MRKVSIPKVSLKNIRLSPFAGNTKLVPMPKGKFTDDSTSTKWWYRANKYSGEKIDISAYVNPSTKKFEIRPIQCTPFFYLNDKLETVKIADNTGNVQSLRRLMSNCSQLLSVDLQGMNTKNVTDMRSVFSGCSSLISLDLSSFDTSKVTNMYQMFNDCQNLQSVNLSSFDTANVEYMDEMFADCRSLSSLDLSNFNTQKVKHIGRMFDSCYSLAELDLSNFDTSSLLSTFHTFMDCGKMSTLNLSGWNFSSLQENTDMFAFCSSLSTVIGPVTGIKLSLDLSDCPLTNESAMVFINGLDNVSSNQTLEFSRDTWATLTPEQIAIATSKGWTVVVDTGGDTGGVN